ncbi:hypothetical protein [Pedobacter sp. MC2016-24]|uniref:hypothetical protein n=1 Tax=Pedobacter sp. MC2016-24 TaxID=2780090 RepID=UPI0018812439|nr:hypothetical protein [Pedobacter sp. MC2016-24]MBE9599864.1 hypothetical protein [Pedobacter sp. MC2016-24]
MAKHNSYRKLNITKNNEQWYLHQKIGKFLLDLDNVQDLAAIQKNKPRPAPLQLLNLIF